MASGHKEAFASRLPASLAGQIGQFERRLRRIETVTAVLGGLCAALSIYAVLFASDRLWDTPPWLRCPLTAIGVGVLSALLLRWGGHWLWRRRDRRQLARLVQRYHRRLGDRLLGAVELADGENKPPGASAALCRAAIEQVAGEARRYDFRKAVNTLVFRRAVLICLFLAVLGGGAAAMAPEAAWSTLRRLWRPMSPLPRYTFSRLVDLPEQLIVPSGEPFEIACRLDASSRWHPAHAVGAVAGQATIRAAFENGATVFRVPGQTEPATIVIRAGDDSAAVRIEPALRPELESLLVSARLPAYLDRGTVTNRVVNGTAEILEGSAVTFVGTASRALARVSMTAGAEDGGGCEVTVRGRRFMTPEFGGDLSDVCTFAWEDVLGLEGAEPFELAIRTSPDGAPLVTCEGPARAVAIIEEEVVNFDIAAEDDYGIRGAWVAWQSVEKDPTAAPGLSGRAEIAEGAVDVPAVSGSFAFCPATAGIPPATAISLRALAVDGLPGRTPSESSEYLIYVLSKAQHAELIRRGMEAVQARLDELARREETLLEENRETLGLATEELAARKTAEELEQRRGREDAHADELRDIAADAGKVLGEALRNPSIRIETLSEWMSLVDEMQALAAGEMSLAAAALDRAAKSPEQRPADLNEAVELEQAVVDALRRMEGSMDASLDALVAANFVNRLREAARRERGVASDLKSIAPATIGCPREELKKEDLSTVDRVVGVQEDTAGDVRYIQDDLAGFFRRTGIEDFGVVYDEMKQADFANILASLSREISQNRCGRSIGEVEASAARLDAWADFLAPRADCAGKAGCRGLSAMDMETLLALMRIRRREEMLRESTRALEESRPRNAGYGEDADELARRQSGIASDTRDLGASVGNPTLRQLLGIVLADMAEAETMLCRPQTDAETVAVETEIIELLSQCMSSCAGSACMSLAQMAGMSGGPSGGGSLAGGAAGETEAARGAASGAADDPRAVEGTGGNRPEAVPREFREVLEAYRAARENLSG